MEESTDRSRRLEVRNYISIVTPSKMVEILNTIVNMEVPAALEVSNPSAGSIIASVKTEKNEPALVPVASEINGPSTSSMMVSVKTEDDTAIRSPLSDNFMIGSVKTENVNVKTEENTEYNTPFRDPDRSVYVVLSVESEEPNGTKNIVQAKTHMPLGMINPYVNAFIAKSEETRDDPITAEMNEPPISPMLVSVKTEEFSDETANQMIDASANSIMGSVKMEEITEGNSSSMLVSVKSENISEHNTTFRSMVPMALDYSYIDIPVKTEKISEDEMDDPAAISIIEPMKLEGTARKTTTPLPKKIMPSSSSMFDTNKTEYFELGDFCPNKKTGTLPKIKDANGTDKSNIVMPSSMIYGIKQDGKLEQNTTNNKEDFPNKNYASSNSMNVSMTKKNTARKSTDSLPKNKNTKRLDMGNIVLPSTSSMIGAINTTNNKEDFPKNNYAVAIDQEIVQIPSTRNTARKSTVGLPKERLFSNVVENIPLGNTSDLNMPSTSSMSNTTKKKKQTRPYQKRKSDIEVEKAANLFLSDFDPDTSNREMNKIAKRLEYYYEEKLYDEDGIHIETGLDLCDCLERKCPGCFYPCPNCGSIKCGVECRCLRTYRFDGIEYEGYNYERQSPFK